MTRRTDNTQGDIVAALRDVGASVVDLHRVGHGCPDLAVAYRGRTWLMEVKTATGSLRANQREFISAWQDAVHVVRCPSDALRAIGVME